MYSYLILQINLHKGLYNLIIQILMISITIIKKLCKENIHIFQKLYCNKNNYNKK
jgi:hypothetical protein